MSSKPTYEELERKVRELKSESIERKKVEKALKESEERLSHAQSVAHLGFWDRDIPTGDLFWSDENYPIFGLDLQEKIEPTYEMFINMVHPEDRDFVNERINAALRGDDEEYSVDCRIVRPSGEIRWIYSQGRVTRDEKGIPVRFVGTHIDITDRKLAEESLQRVLNELEQRVEKRTAEIIKVNEQLRLEIAERKQAEEALRESRERLKNIHDSLHVGIVLIDPETHRITDVNYAAVKMIGDSRERLIGSLCHNYICPAKEGMCPITDLGKRMDNSDCILLKAGGGAMPVLKTVTSVTLNGQEFLLESFIDITQEKELEVQLQQARKMEAMGKLAGGIAHDFNNLLMGIEGNASLVLLDIDPAHPHYEKLKNIEQHVRSGAELTGQLLGFARRGKYEVKPTNLNELIEKSSNMFSRTRKEIEIHRTYQEDIWTVEVDQGQIEQTLLNLYVNAWQAMPGGGELYLQTKNVTLDENYVKPYHFETGNYVKISVTDTGIGMDEATKDKIFDPFFTTKEMGSDKGTGLGLASAYGIIKNHHGFINVYSEKGIGTTFNIYLPVSKKDVKEEIREKKLPDGFLKGTETILFVDDEEMIINVGEEILKTLGYTVLIARSGKEAVETYKENKDKISMVILDMIMPDIDGGKTYDILKEINPEIKVLLSSGYSINGKAMEIMRRGCNDFIQKPFNISQFSQKIREILEE